MNSEYDSFAGHFSATRDRAWPEFEILFPYIQKSDKVLDLGCGNGRLQQFLSTNLTPSGCYFGLDISEKLLSIARQNFPKDHFFRSDFVSKLPFGGEHFDVTVSIAAFHHLLSVKAQRAFLSECFRVTNAGGILFLTTWKLPQKYF